MESKKQNKLVNTKKKIRLIDIREQTSGYQWEEGRGTGSVRVRE